VVRKQYAFTNRIVETAELRWIRQAIDSSIPRERAYFSSCGFTGSASNTLEVVAPPEDIPVWENFVGRMDVPASGE